MRRADRLFQIVQFIRGRRLTTAALLAQRLEVSERTVYRDVADLQRQGVPIEGEAGVGYRLGAGFEMPPLIFTRAEASALVAAARLAQSWLDPAMAGNAETALGKILSVLPPGERVSAEALAMFAPALGADEPTRKTLQVLRESVEAKRKLRLRYRDLAESSTARVVRPLGCFYWGKVWTLAAWCELRNDFRGFRVDRIEHLEPSAEHFRDEAGKTLAAMLRRVQYDASAAPKRSRS